MAEQITFNNFQEFATWAVGEPDASKERLDRWIYKGTDCGAWLAIVAPGPKTVRTMDMPVYFSYEPVDGGFRLLEACFYGSLPEGIIREACDAGLDHPTWKIDLEGLDASWAFQAACVDPETRMADEGGREFLATCESCDDLAPWIGDLGGYEIPTGENHLGGIRVGSIVEGSDAEVTADALMFPFTLADWDQTIDWVEGEVEVLWNEANGDDEGEEGED